MKTENPAPLEYYIEVAGIKFPQKMNGSRLNFHAQGILCFYYFKNFNAVVLRRSQHTQKEIK